MIRCVKTRLNHTHFKIGTSFHPSKLVLLFRGTAVFID